MTAIDLRPVLGAKPDGKTGARLLLVCYYDPNGISTVYEHVRLWQKFSVFPIQVLNLWPRTPLRIPADVDLNDFAGVILHPTVGYFPANLTGLDANIGTKFANYGGVKVLVKQDEHFRTAAYPKFIADNGFDILVTCVPPGELEKVYPREIVGDIEVVHALTGYVSDYMRTLDHQWGSARRPTDICYRGSLQPLSVGRLGYEKRQIGSAVHGACQGQGLTMNISSRWEDRIFGTAWFDFLAQSNAVLGVESGSNLFDYDGEVFDWCSAYERENAELDPWSDEYYLKAHAAKLKDYEGNVNYGQISPRHFEAAATRTLQIMYEGQYSGIFEPGRHFVPLKRDLSNLSEAVDALRDPAECKRITDAAFEEIILNPSYHYQAFVQRMDDVLQTVMERKGSGPRASTRTFGSRPRAAYLMSHDPVIDPRVTWMAESLAETYELCQVGFHSLPGSGPVVRQIGPHHTRLILERSRHDWDWLPRIGATSEEMAGLSQLLQLHLYSELKPHELARQIGALGATEEDLTRFRWHLHYFVNTNGALYQAIRNTGDFDLVVATDLDTLPAAIALGRLYGCPVIYDAHEYWPFSSLAFSSWESEFWAALERTLSRQADIRISVSAPLADHMSQEYGADFLTVPNATPMTPMPQRSDRLARDRDLIVLVQGNFAPGRGYERMIAAWPLVNPGIHLALRGPDTPYKQTIVDLAASMGLGADRVSFPPPLPPDQMVEGAADADIAVVPYEPTAITYRLACPNKFSEYLAAGRPILSNRLDYLAPMIEGHQLGRVVDFSDPKALSTAINAMASEPELLTDMGRRARAFFESSYNWEAVSAELFRRVVELARPARPDARPLDFEWVRDRSEMRASSANALVSRAAQVEEAGPDAGRTADLISPIDLQGLKIPEAWQAAGGRIETTLRGPRITLPEAGLSYAALLPVDWSAVDFELQDVWVRISVTEVVGSILVAFFDPETDYLAAQRYVPEGAGAQVFYFKPEAPYADYLLFRTGPYSAETSLIVSDAAIIAASKPEKEASVDMTAPESQDGEPVRAIDGTERIVRPIPLSAVQTIPFWEEQGARLALADWELELTTPPTAWHYAAVAELDWADIDLTRDRVWLRLGYRALEGDIRAGLFDPRTNDILQEVALPSDGRDVAIAVEQLGPWQLLLRTGDVDQAGSVILQNITLVARPADRVVATSTAEEPAAILASDMGAIPYWEQQGAAVHQSDGEACVQTPPIAWHYAAVADLPPLPGGDNACLEVRISQASGEAYVALYEPAQDRVLTQSLVEAKAGSQTVHVDLAPHLGAPTSGLQLMIRTGSIDAAARLNFSSARFVNRPLHPPTPPAPPPESASPVNDAPRPDSRLTAAGETLAGPLTDLETSTYWTEHNVTLHRRYGSPEESLEYFHWRNDQYIDYISLMPVNGFDDKVVLDYGCGPGHDLVGFGHYSKPRTLIGADVSRSSLAEAADRLAIHGIQAELTHLDIASPRLPFEDESIDHIHSSGVIHHAPDPLFILKELRRILKPGGTMNIMVYNYNSLWFHLYVAYIQRITEGLYDGLSPREAFTKSTDGPDCPISNAYRPQEWIALCGEAGLKARFTGAAISLWEASLAPRRFEACMNEKLGVEHREFLLNLSTDHRGLPLHNGDYAGVDGCYEITRI